MNYIYKLSGYLAYEPDIKKKCRVKYPEPIFIANPRDFIRRRNKNGTRFVDLKQLVEIPIKR